MDEALRRLVQGFAEFRRRFFETDPTLFNDLVQHGQRPRVLVVACSDSRADPAILTRARPGDLFIVRNVAALVPPYHPDPVHHGTSSAIEFAVRGLGVGHVVVLGHRRCGGIGALKQPPPGEWEYLGRWVEILAEARDAVDAAGIDPAERGRILELAGLLCSLRNLFGYPWVRARVADGSLALHAWYFDLEEGTLLGFDPGGHRFAPVGESLTPVAEAPDLARFLAGLGRVPGSGAPASG